MKHDAEICEHAICILQEAYTHMEYVRREVNKIIHMFLAETFITPDEVFPEYELEKWAEENGYVKEGEE